MSFEPLQRVSTVSGLSMEELGRWGQALEDARVQADLFTRLHTR